MRITNRSFVATTVGIVATLMIFGCSNADPIDSGCPNGAMEEVRVPLENIRDLVSYSDQLTVFTVISDREIPPPPEVIENGEGYVGRKVTIRVDQTLWKFRPDNGFDGELEFNGHGWIMHDEILRPVFFGNGTRLEVGKQYVGLFSEYFKEPASNGVWGPTAPSTTYGVENGHAIPPCTSDLWRAPPTAPIFVGKSFDEISQSFSEAVSYPLVLENADRDAASRFEAVQIVERSRRGTPTVIPEPVLAVAEPNPDGYYETVVLGRLVREDNCLYVEDSGGFRWVPVFPFDSASWEDGGLIFDDKRFEPGDEIGLGGGEERYRGPSGFAQHPAPGCLTARVWIASPDTLNIPPDPEIPASDQSDSEIGAGDSSSVETREPSYPPASLSDVQARANDYQKAIGVDADEALRRAKLLVTIDPTIAGLREESTGILAGLAFNHDPDLTIQLRLTEPPSSALQSVIDSSPIPVVVDSSALLSLEESRKRIASIDVISVISGLQGYSTDERTGELVLDVFVEDGPDKSSIQAENELARIALIETLGLPVRIDYSSGPLELQGTR